MTVKQIAEYVSLPSLLSPKRQDSVSVETHNYIQALTILGRRSKLRTRTSLFARVFGFLTLYVDVDCSEVVKVKVGRGNGEKGKISDVQCTVNRVSGRGWGEDTIKRRGGGEE